MEAHSERQHIMSSCSSNCSKLTTKLRSRAALRLLGRLHTAVAPPVCCCHMGLVERSRKDGPYRRLPIRPGNQCVFASARRGRMSVPLHPARRCATLMFFGPDEEAGILRKSSPQGRVAQNSFSIRALTFCASNRDFGGLPSHQGYPPKILLRRRALRQQN